MTTSPRPTGRHTVTDNPLRERCGRRTLRPSGHLSELGVEITATRLRVLGHPARLRIMRALDGRQATVAELASGLSLTEAATRVHVQLLHRMGILARIDDVGPPAFELADWPSMWMVDQLARRLREQTEELVDYSDADSDEGDGFPCC